MTVSIAHHRLPTLDTQENPAGKKPLDTAVITVIVV
jgi:hypothetical protein